MATSTTPLPPPPGPRSPTLVQMAHLYLDPVGYLERCRRKFGPVFRIDYPGSAPFAMIADAELARELYARDRDIGRAGEAREPFLAPFVGSNSLLCLEGETWQRHRQLVSAPLHGQRVTGWGDQIAQIAAAEIDTWPQDEPFPVHPRMQCLTLEVMLRIVFGIEDLDRLKRLRTLLPQLLDTLAIALPGVRRLLERPALRRIPGNPMRRFLAIRTEADRLIYDEITRRRSQSDRALEERDDLLSMLLLARDENGEPMTDVELRDELMTMLVAGHETTATGLAWALERLVRHPDALRRLRDTLAHDDRSYLEAAVKETLRIRPVVLDTPRLLAEPLDLAGHRIPKGWLASCSIPSVHLTAETFDHPEQFDPDRFLGPDPPNTSWLPFGGGRRRCVGSRLALLELHIVLATVVERCDLRAPEANEERQRFSGVTLRPAKGATIIVGTRNGTSKKVGPTHIDMRR